MRALHKQLRSQVLAAALALSAFLATAEAADVTVRVKDHGGNAVADAVVTLTGQTGATADHPTGPPVEKIVDQKNETFVPYVEIFRPGDRVVFRNSDSTRHHVYSFSRIKTFEFVLKPGESSPALTLDKTGTAAIGCNIHDHMISYLVVSDAAHIAKSGSDGVIRFGNVPVGTYTVHVWHPQLHPGRPEMSEQVQVTAAGEAKAVDFALSLLPDPRMQMRDEY